MTQAPAYKIRLFLWRNVYSKILLYRNNIVYFGASGSPSLLVKDSISGSKRIFFKLEKAQHAARDLIKYFRIFSFHQK